MNIEIRPINIDDKIAVEGVISVAVSDSVAIRIVPIIDGVEHPDHALGLVGTADSDDTVTLLAAVRDAVQTFATGRGV